MGEVPPLVGVAVNGTVDRSQRVVEGVLTETDGVTRLLTVMVLETTCEGQPDIARVYLMGIEPLATPVTSPVFETPAMRLLLLLHVPPATAFAYWVFEPVQTTDAPVMAGKETDGFTRTVAVLAVPAQEAAIGVTVKVTVYGVEAEVLVSFPEMVPVFPVALPAMSEAEVTVEVLSLVQLKVVPTTLLEVESASAVMLLPEHIVWLAGVTVATGTGFTTTLALIGEPAQVLGDVGVMVKVTVNGAFEVFVILPVMLPEPEDAIPVTEEVLSLVQAYVVPLTELLVPSTTVAMLEPEQIVCVLFVAVATGVVFTVMATTFEEDVQPLNVATAV